MFPNSKTDECEDSVRKMKSQQDQTFYAKKWVALENHTVQLDITVETSVDDGWPGEMEEIFILISYIQLFTNAVFQSCDFYWCRGFSDISPLGLKGC